MLTKIKLYGSINLFNVILFIFHVLMNLFMPIYLYYIKLAYFIQSI